MADLCGILCAYILIFSITTTGVWVANGSHQIHRRAAVTDNKTVLVDNHLYYTSTVQNNPELGRFYWVDLQNRSDLKISLSGSRKTITHRLSFEFPFYGYLIKYVRMTNDDTSGSVYTGDYVPSRLGATQYIAPLLANFDSLPNDSYIKYIDNGTAFTVEWENVSLTNQSGWGRFTFQTTLFQNGDIVFVYKDVPSSIQNITDVIVGISDAYVLKRTLFGVPRKRFYEYHRIYFNPVNVGNWTVIYLTALPTCLQHQDCVSCFSNVTSDFQCSWCSTSNKCSTGVDRNRQEWLTNQCQKSDASVCSDANMLNQSQDAHGQ